MKRFRVFILVIVLVLSNCNVVKAEVNEDYKTFSQGDPRWKDYVYGGGKTIGSSGCFITAICVLMAYAEPELRDPDVFNPETLAQKLTFSGAALVSTSVENYNGHFKKVADDDNSSGFSETELKEKVVGYIKQGYYVTIMATKQPVTGGTHFSPIVGLDENDNPILWDVNGGKNSDFNTWAGAGVTDIDVFESTVSKSYDNLQGGSGGNTAPSDEDVKEAESYTISESELEGMPDAGKLTENQIPIIIVGRENLSISETNNIEEIGNNIGIRNRMFNILNVSFMFIGLCLMVYSVLLLVAGQMDVVNEWVEISMVERFTFGKCRVVKQMENDEVAKSLSNGDFTLKQWRIRCIVVGLVGGLLVSGILYKVIVFIVYKKIFKW